MSETKPKKKLNVDLQATVEKLFEPFVGSDSESEQALAELQAEMEKKFKEKRETQKKMQRSNKSENNGVIKKNDKGNVSSHSNGPRTRSSQKCVSKEIEEGNSSMNGFPDDTETNGQEHGTLTNRLETVIETDTLNHNTSDLVQNEHDNKTSSEGNDDNEQNGLTSNPLALPANASDYENNASENDYQNSVSESNSRHDPNLINNSENSSHSNSNTETSSLSDKSGRNSVNNDAKSENELGATVTQAVQKQPIIKLVPLEQLLKKQNSALSQTIKVHEIIDLSSSDESENVTVSKTAELPSKSKSKKSKSKQSSSSEDSDYSEEITKNKSPKSNLKKSASDVVDAHHSMKRRGSKTERPKRNASAYRGSISIVSDSSDSENESDKNNLNENAAKEAVEKRKSKSSDQNAEIDASNIVLKRLTVSITKFPKDMKQLLVRHKLREIRDNEQKIIVSRSVDCSSGSSSDDDLSLSNVKNMRKKVQTKPVVFVMITAFRL